MPNPIDQISDILGAPKGWLDKEPVTPEQARQVLQAVLNDVNPAVMGDTYQTFINSVRYVGAQYGTDI